MVNNLLEQGQQKVSGEWGTFNGLGEGSPVVFRDER